MRRNSFLFCSATAIAAVLGAMPLRGEILGREVSYESGGTILKGYLAYDSSIEDARPGVLVVHEWWGHNDYARSRARKLAELGYVALAVDMYGDGKQAEHPEDAGKFSSAVMNNMAEGRARFEAAEEFLKKQPQTNPKKIAAIGYCFGGAIVLQMARQGLDLDAVVSFHGSLAAKAPAERGAIKARILVCHGAADRFISEDQVEAFKKEMDEAGADYVLEAYAGALHGFTNPSADELGEKFGIPLAYNKEADEKSWAAMRALLGEVFR